MKFHRAPWEPLLIFLSVVLTIVCLGVTAWVLRSSIPGAAWMAPILMVSVIICGLLTVRGYSIGQGTLLIHRLFWTTRLPLEGVESAEFEPNAMRWSIRLFGNSGFYSFTGYYRNKQLGTYRAFVTDRQRTVVLRVGGKTIVVSPESAESFIADVMAVRSGK